MEQAAKFQAVFNGEIYPFRTGAHLYIFDCGLFWDMDKYGIDEFQKYIEFVYNCYLEADDPIPLGSLSDYIAEQWDDIQAKDLTIYDVLEKFWNQLL